MEESLMTETIALTLITQEQMSIDTAFDFICMCGVSMTKEQNLCIISPQRARKEVAKREAIEVAIRTNCKSIMFIRDKERFVPETLNELLKGKKEVVGCNTSRNPGMMSTDLMLIDIEVFKKINRPYFGVGMKAGSHDTDPDYFKFFQECEKAGIKAYCADHLSEANKKIAPVSRGGIKINARRIPCGNPFGKVVTIAIPTEDLIYTHTASDIAQLVATNNHLVRAFVIVNVQTDEIETARNISAEVAKSEKSDLIFLIDSDMRLPQDALMRLMSRKKQIIGVNAVKRDGSGTPIFRKNLFGRPFDYKKGDTEKVHFIGMGATLIDMAVFDALDKPWFYPNYEVGSDNWRGEDYTFCWEAKRKGFHIWCDVGLSKEIGHIGAQAYYLGVK